jgi:hypothetical protein
MFSVRQQHLLSGFGDGVSVSNRHSYVTFDTSDITSTGTNENRVDYPSLSTTRTSVLPFATEGVFFKVRHMYSVWWVNCAGRSKCVKVTF